MQILQEEREGILHQESGGYFTPGESHGHYTRGESHGHFTQKRLAANMERKPSNIGRDHKAYLQCTLTSYKAISGK